MNKLLLILFSLMLSFNSYGEWVYIDKENNSDTEVYVLKESIEIEEGYVYWATLNNYSKPRSEYNIMGLAIFRGGDCEDNSYVNIESQMFQGSMGTKSFGKGSVQTIQELQNGSAVKITTARYFTPNGRSIQAKGIMPDIELKTLRLPASDTNGRKSFSENDLSGHLSNPEDDETLDGEQSDTPENEEGVQNLAEVDFQLYEALNLLKGMNILNQVVKK